MIPRLKGPEAIQFHFTYLAMSRRPRAAGTLNRQKLDLHYYSLQIVLLTDATSQIAIDWILYAARML